MFSSKYLFHYYGEVNPKMLNTIETINYKPLETIHRTNYFSLPGKMKGGGGGCGMGNFYIILASCSFM